MSLFKVEFDSMEWQDVRPGVRHGICALARSRQAPPADAERSWRRALVEVNAREARQSGAGA